MTCTCNALHLLGLESLPGIGEERTVYPNQTFVNTRRATVVVVADAVFSAGVAVLIFVAVLVSFSSWFYLILFKLQIQKF